MFWVSHSINKQIWRGWQHEIPPREEVACLPLQPFCHENQAKRLKPNAPEEKEVMQNQIFPKEKLGSPAAKGDLGEEQKRGARMCPPSHLQVTSSSDMKVQSKWSWMHSVQDFHCKYQNKGGIPPKHCPEMKGQGKGRPKMETSRTQQEYKVQLKMLELGLGGGSVIKCLPCKAKDQSLIPRTHTHTCNPSTWETEMGRSPGACRPPHLAELSGLQLQWETVSDYKMENL